MRIRLASRLASLARILSTTRDRWNYYAEWPPRSEADGLAFYPAYGTEGNDVLPRLVFTKENDGINIRSVWYDGRTDTIRITLAGRHFDGRSKKFQTKVARRIPKANNNSSRQGRGTASIQISSRTGVEGKGGST